MSNLLLALWMSLIGADRIDLAGGHAAFILTPFLALTPLVLVSEATRRVAHGTTIAITRAGVWYVILAGTLLTLSAASVFVAPQIPIGAERAFLLLAQMGGTFFVALLVADRADARRVLARGAAAGLVVFLLFDPLEALYWTGHFAEQVRLGPVLVKFGELQSIGPIPKFAGPVSDGNRAGFVLLCYIVLIAWGEPRPWLRRALLFLNGLLIASTMSRSAALGVGAAVITTILVKRQLSPRVLIVGPALVLLMSGILMLRPHWVDGVVGAVRSPLAERLSTLEGSGADHLRLVERGLNDATESVPRMLIGLGYGNSYLFLQDFFPGIKYGSYHSLYTSVFAECGVFALLTILAILFVPLAVAGAWRAPIAACIAFNIFYQSNTEPIFYFVLACAWLSLRVKVRRAPLAVTAPEPLVA